MSRPRLEPSVKFYHSLWNEGTRAEPQTLRKFDNPLILKCFPSGSHVTVRTFVRTPKQKWESSTITIGQVPITSMGTSLILDNHVMTYWQLSRQGIRWLVSRDHIAGSGQELIEVFYFCMLTADQVLGFHLDHRLQPDYYSAGEEWSTCKGTISAQIKPQRVVDFSYDMFLTQSLYLGCVRSTLGGQNLAILPKRHDNSLFLGS